MKYICPICEHELVGKSWCPACRKRISNPWKFDGNTLPNQSSRAVYSYFEDECGRGHKHRFGIPNVDPHRSDKAPVRDQPFAPVRDQPFEPVREKKEPVTYKDGAYNGKYRPLLIFLLIFFVFLIVSTLFSIFSSLLFSGNTDNYEEESGAAEVQNVLDTAEPCTGYAHYNVMGTDFEEAFQVCVHNIWSDAKTGLSESNIEIYTDSEDKTYNEVHQTIYLSYAGLEGYTGVISDLATGEVMQVKIQSTDPELLIQQTAIAQYILNSGIYDITEIRTEMRIFFQDFTNHFNTGEKSYSALWETSVLYMGEDPGEPVMYYVYLNCQEEYGKYYSGN